MKAKVRILSLVLLLSIFVVSCGDEEFVVPEASAPEEDILTADKSAKNAINASSSQLTSHFRNWLSANGYGSYNFAGGPGRSYGGRTSNSDPVNNHPVIFIHGNGDKAVGTSTSQSGWTASIDYFLSKGYRSSELYAMTWGPASLSQTPLQYHSRSYIDRIRRFIQAVKAYTGASRVDVIGHSMGVTLARKAIKGGTAYDQAIGGYYNVGSRLSYVDTFVGIAGANYGLTSCFFSGTSIPTCSDRNGFYPGYLYFGAGPYGVSEFLTGLNNNSSKEGTYVYSLWSTVDEVIGGGTLVYGRYTCRIPRQNGERVFTSFPYGHWGVKDRTGYQQWRMVKYHRTN
ncbi:MAG: lipase [Bacteroidota bacterium]